MHPQFRGTVSSTHNPGTQNAVVTRKRSGLPQRHDKYNYVLFFQNLQVLMETNVSDQRHIDWYFPPVPWKTKYTDCKLLLLIPFDRGLGQNRYRP
jgi:hypothetical protein